LQVRTRQHGPKGLLSEALTLEIVLNAHDVVQIVATNVDMAFAKASTGVIKSRPPYKPYTRHRKPCVGCAQFRGPGLLRRLHVWSGAEVACLNVGAGMFRKRSM